jgi:hypothetical protein
MFKPLSPGPASPDPFATTRATPRAGTSNSHRKGSTMSPNRILNTALAALLICAVAPPSIAAPAGKSAKSAKAKAKKAAKVPGAGLKPEQVADMYIQVMLKNDVETAKRLNDYVRPEFSGEDQFDIATLEQSQQSSQTQYSQFADGLLAEMPKVSAKKAKPVLVSAMLAQSAAASGSECRALSSKTHPNEYIQGQQIAEVTYECRVPAIDGGLQQRLESKGAPKSIKTKVALEVFTGYQKAFASAGGNTRTINGTMSLYGFPGKPWLTNGADQILQFVTDGMLETPPSAD